MRTILILSVVVLLAACKNTDSTPKEVDMSTYRIGQKKITYKDESRDRPIVTEIWYPTYDADVKPPTGKKEVFKPIATIPNAKMLDKKFPLLLVSHGTGGNRFSLTWFVDKMVREGYVVAAVDHYGNSTWNKIPREFVKWWERPIDIQYLLTSMLADEKVSGMIDPSKIGGVGFSLGGYTHIALAGGYVDRSKAAGQPLPAEYPKTDEVIDFATDKEIVESYLKHKDNVKDPRIKAFFTIAPAIGFGFYDKEQTKSIDAPVMIVAGKGDTNTPIATNAMVFDSLIATSQLHLFNEHVNHYTFLNEGTDFGKKIIRDLVTDHPSVDRGKIHAETVELAKRFFKENL